LKLILLFLSLLKKNRQQNSDGGRLIDDRHALDDLARQYLPLELLEELIPIARANNVIVPDKKKKKGEN